MLLGDFMDLLLVYVHVVSLHSLCRRGVCCVPIGRLLVCSKYVSGGDWLSTDCE